MSKAIQILEKYSPCDVADALLKFGVKSGGFLPNLQRFSTGTKPTVVGKAYTVLYAPLSDSRPAIKDGYIDFIPEESVVVIALTKELQTPNAPFVKVNNALYGGLMSTRANYLGAKGTVVFGRIRDVEEHRDLKYPVFAYGLGIAAPGSVVKVVGVNVPLEIEVNEGEFEVIEPGELISADENGVARIPKDLSIDDLTSYIPNRVEADKLVAQDIKEGKLALPSQKLRRSGL